MTSTSEPPDQDLLARIAAGDLAPNAPEVLARRERDVAFGREVDEIVATLAMLGAAADEERAWLDEAASAPSPPLRPGLAADTIARLAAESGASPARERRRWVAVFALAAAAALVVAAWLALRPDGPRPDDRPLGNAHLSLLRPGLERDALVLEWKSDLDGARFTIAIWAAEDPLRQPVLEQETKEQRWRIESNVWRPLASRGQALRWRVVASRGSFTAEQVGDLALPR